MDALAAFANSPAFLIAAGAVLAAAIAGTIVKHFNEGTFAKRATLARISGAMLAALAPYCGVVLDVIINGPAPSGRSWVGTAVALIGIAAGCMGLFVAARGWPAVFKIVGLLVYSLLLGWSLFYVALIAACAFFKNCL